VATLELLHKQLAEAKRRQAIVSTPETERDLARQYEGLGILDAAFDHYRIALRLQPRDTTSLDAVARIWRDWGYPHLGLSSAYRAVYFSPKRAAAQNTLGTLLLQLGNVDAARERFERARQLDPEAAYPLNNMCFLELKTGRTDDAVRLCRVALDRDPTSVRSRNNLVVALAKGGDLDGATAVIHEDASSAVAAYNHGVLLLAMGKRDDARDAFARARVADPSYLPALNRLRVMNTAYRGFQ
jgi:tetratricopeptide (TPR) repeat protein